MIFIMKTLQQEKAEKVTHIGKKTDTYFLSEPGKYHIALRILSSAPKLFCWIRHYSLSGSFSKQKPRGGNETLILISWTDKTDGSKKLERLDLGFTDTTIAGQSNPVGDNDPTLPYSIGLLKPWL